jgi:DNA-dependent RNA polymerase auxiliary subunit epsilon
MIYKIRLHYQDDKRRSVPHSEAHDILYLGA